jgi:hypothetical protein
LTRITSPGTKDVLEVCQSVELSCAEMYHYFAELFKRDRESSLLWLKLAMEKENHARLFGLMAKLRQHNLIEAVRIEQSDIEVNLCYVQSLSERVRREPPSGEEALLLAVDLEQKLGGFMIENFLSSADLPYEKSLLAGASAGSSHLESLRNLLLY